MEIVRDVLARGYDQLLGRVTGPLNIRLITTPLIVAVLALRAGWTDAKNGRPPFLWRALTHPDERKEIFREGWKSIQRVIVLAFVLDLAYQLYVFRAFYIFQTIILVVLLAVVPYVLIRGVTTRLMKVLNIGGTQKCSPK